MPSTTDLVTDVVARLRPLEVELAQAWWVSNTESSPDAEARRVDAELARQALLADPDMFAAVRDGRDCADHTDPSVQRQLDLLYDAFAPHQIPEDLRRAMVELETGIESTFNNFRGDMYGTRVDDNAITEVLRSSNDEAERRGVGSVEAGRRRGGRSDP